MNKRELATYIALGALACMAVGVMLAVAVILGLNASVAERHAQEVESARTKCSMVMVADARPEFARRKRCDEWAIYNNTAECVR